jgi:DNA-binding GntR family transcriptional regulator
MSLPLPSGRRPLNEIVGTVLGEHIRSGALPPGFVLREKAVSDLFGIGRMPASVAMARLEAEGLGHRRPAMHGIVIGQDPEATLVAGGLEQRVRLPRDIAAEVKIRNWRALIYPAVEREVASCLLFGRFLIRSQALAEHFGVSRTVAHELLLRLERVGLVQQGPNARWYAGPLTSARIHDLYEMRILLEPQALRQAYPRTDAGMLREKLARVVLAEAPEARLDTTLLHRLEVDLHQDILLGCTNAELRNTLYRSQIPLITVHLSFGAYAEQTDIPLMIGRHKAILQDLIDGQVEDAAEALAVHLQESSDHNPRRLSGLRPLEVGQLAPYLDPV